MTQVIDFHFDYLSPYAYLGWTQIHALAERHGVNVRPVPVLFPALLDAHGTVGPAEVPAKRTYVAEDAARRAAVLGLRLAPPPVHPFNPLLALRVSLVPTDSDEQRRLIDCLYAATWAEGPNGERPPGVADALAVGAAVVEAGLDPDATLEAAASQPVKDRLRENTEAAIARGVFGVPTSVVGDARFWGVDSLPMLELHLAGKDPLDPAALERWEGTPVGASRRR